MLLYPIYITDGNVYENLYEYGGVVWNLYLYCHSYRFYCRYRRSFGKDLPCRRSSLRYTPEVLNHYKNCVREEVMFSDSNFVEDQRTQSESRLQGRGLLLFFVVVYRLVAKSLTIVYKYHNPYLKKPEKFYYALIYTIDCATINAYSIKSGRRAKCIYSFFWPCFCLCWPWSGAGQRTKTYSTPNQPPA